MHPVLPFEHVSLLIIFEQQYNAPVVSREQWEQMFFYPIMLFSSCMAALKSFTAVVL